MFLGYFENPNGMAMKMYQGTLKDLIFNKEMVYNHSNALQMISDIANGCLHIHQFGLVHFDIKPLNVLFEVTSDPSTEFGIRCVISDFGAS